MSKFTIFILLVMLLLFASGDMQSYFCPNIANVILNKNLWQEHVMVGKRQTALALSARFLDAVSMEHFLLEENTSDEPYVMISAILSAEHYRRRRQYDETVIWLRRAAVASAHPSVQKAIMVPGWGKLTLDGTMIFDGSIPFWEVRQDTSVNAEVDYKDKVTVVLSWHNESGQQNRGSFVWTYPLYIPYHHTIVLDVRVQPQCVLLFETVVDGKLVRHFSHPGTGQWERLTATVEGDNLRFIYIHLDGETEQQVRCEAEISALSFLVDQNVVCPHR